MVMDEHITVSATWGRPGSIEVHGSPLYREELLGQLEDNGVDAARIVHSAGGGGHFIFEIIDAAGAAASIAAALLAFLSRHKGTRFQLRVGDHEYTVEDCSPRQAQEWIKTALDEVEAQAEREKNRWESERGHPDGEQ